MTERIVFLDIDGPIITDSMFELDEFVSYDRTFMNANALGYVAALCRAADAKVVTNSTHNTHQSPPFINLDGKGPDLKTDLIYHGFPEKYFHEDWRTKFTHSKDNLLEYSRLDGITTWLIDHDMNLNDKNWVCFDDDKFTNRKNLILVDSRCGITYADYVEACNFWDVDITI